MSNLSNFKVKNYLITPKDIYLGVKHIFKKASFNDLIRLAVVLIFLVIFKLYLSLSLESIFFLLFIIVLFIWKLDSRVSISFGLAALICCPILLILSNQQIMLTGEYWAEKFAVWAYYFLCIGVVKQIIEYIQDNRKKRNQEIERL